jgi:hypothetical protein
MRIALAQNTRHAALMQRRQPQDLYTDTMLWIADGRRSWNRKPAASPSPSRKSGRFAVSASSVKTYPTQSATAALSARANAPCTLPPHELSD